MEYFTNFARLVNSSKLKNRFLTAQVKEAPSPEKTSMGTLFCLIEITKPWFPSAQIGQTIINTLTREYFKGSSTSDLLNFEGAIRKVNETLGQITQNGETEWIGNLNGLLTLVCGNQLYLASTGQAKAYLTRERKILNIIEEKQPSNPPHPLKTFAEITSGTLQINDKVLITNSVILDYFSLENLREILNQSPTEAVLEISKELKKEQTKNVNLVILQFNDKKGLADQILEEAKTVYLDQGSGEFITEFLKKLFSDVSTFLARLREGLHIRNEQSKKFTKEKIIPHTKKGLAKTMELSQKTYSHLRSKAEPGVRKIFHPQPSQSKEKLINKTIFTVRHYDNEPKQKPAKIFPQFIEKFLNAVKSFLGKSKYYLLIALRWLLAPKNRSFLYVIIITILVIILVTNVGILRRKQSNYKKELVSQEMITELNNKYEEAKLALAYNNEVKAKEVFNQIINEALASIEQGVDNEKLAEILQNSQYELDKLTLTTRFNSVELIAEFPQANQLFDFNNNIIIVDPSNNQIHYKNLQENGVKNYASIPTSAGLFKTGTALYPLENPIFLTNNNQLFILKDPALAPDQIKPRDGNWENAQIISSFAENLYFLSSENGQIYKYSKGPEGYSAKEDYLNPNEIDIKESVSLSIDGAIYVLKNNGSIIKLIKGKNQNFSIKDIPTPQNIITNPKKIWTSAEEESIYVLDNNRIIELNKTGRFIKQYAFSYELNDIKDFNIDNKAKKIWILNANKTYQVGL